MRTVVEGDNVDAMYKIALLLEIVADGIEAETQEPVALYHIYRSCEMTIIERRSAARWTFVPKRRSKLNWNAEL